MSATFFPHPQNHSIPQHREQSYLRIYRHGKKMMFLESLLTGRSTIAHRHVIDRIERIIEPTEPNLTKNPIFFILFLRRFFGLQASYRAETLTPDRSGAPRRFQKIENHTESIEPIDSIDRSRDRSNRSTAAVSLGRSEYLLREQANVLVGNKHMSSSGTVQTFVKKS